MRVTGNSNAEKMMEYTEISHGEFRAKECDDVVKKGLGGGSENNVINI